MRWRDRDENFISAASTQFPFKFKKIGEILNLISNNFQHKSDKDLSNIISRDEIFYLTSVP